MEERVVLTAVSGKSGKILAEWSEVLGNISSWEMSGAGTRLAVQRRDGLFIYKIPGGKCHQVIKNPANPISSVHQGKWLGGQNGPALRLYDFESGRPVSAKMIRPGRSMAAITQVDKRGKKALIWGFDEKLGVWDLKKGTCLMECASSVPGAISPDAKLVGSSVFSSSGTTVKVHTIDGKSLAEVVFGERAALVISVQPKRKRQFWVSNFFAGTVEAWRY